MPAVTGLRFGGMRGSAGLGRCGATAGPAKATLTCLGRARRPAAWAPADAM